MVRVDVHCRLLRHMLMPCVLVFECRNSLLGLILMFNLWFVGYYFNVETVFWGWFWCLICDLGDYFIVETMYLTSDLFWSKKWLYLCSDQILWKSLLWPKYLVFYFLPLEPLHSFSGVLCIFLFSLYMFELPIKFIIIITLLLLILTLSRL